MSFIVLFDTIYLIIGFIVLFQLTFTFIYSISIIKKFSFNKIRKFQTNPKTIDYMTAFPICYLSQLLLIYGIICNTSAIWRQRMKFFSRPDQSTKDALCKIKKKKHHLYLAWLHFFFFFFLINYLAWLHDHKSSSPNKV